MKPKLIMSMRDHINAVTRAIPAAYIRESGRKVSQNELYHAVRYMKIGQAVHIAGYAAITRVKGGFAWDHIYQGKV